MDIPLDRTDRPLAPCTSLTEVLQFRAAHQSHDRAYLFINDAGIEVAGLTFGQLAEQARSLACLLRERAEPGERVLLVFPPGLDFLVAYFACLGAGLIAVPVVPPRQNRMRLATLSVVQDCLPALGITAEGMVSHMAQSLTGEPIWESIQWISVAAATGIHRRSATLPGPHAEDIAFLQYTSGSTSAPKGVQVSHRNLLSNLEMIRRTVGTTAASTVVSWVPLYHDMGLILNALHALYVGSMCVLMAPTSFMQRPVGWLAAISRYRAEVAGGPNFGYDLCVDRLKPDAARDIDLSSWKVALNGAEPVRARTIQRFSQGFGPFGFDPRSMYPCYGMAEGTLLLSGGDRNALPVIRSFSRDMLVRKRAIEVELSDSAAIVGCGSSVVDQRLVIVDPETCRPCLPGEIGEIWVAGSHVTGGYWRNPAASAATFRGMLSESGEGPFLRTGDLGFLIDGELFVCGRIKDVIIIRGQNHYPQDIEATAGASHPALRKNFGVAFMIGEQSEERLIVVHEVERIWRSSLDVIEITERVRADVVVEHGVMVSDVVLIRTGTLPKTSSGKVQRRATRQLYLDGTLDIQRDQHAQLENSSLRM